MSVITISDDDYATVTYLEEDRIIDLTWHQSTHGADFRDRLNTVLQLVEDYGSTKLLADDRKKIGIQEDDIQWVLNDWLPRALDAGWKYWALVAAMDGKTLINFKKIIDHFRNEGMSIMVFDTPDIAQRWLKLQK